MEIHWSKIHWRFKNFHGPKFFKNTGNIFRKLRSSELVEIILLFKEICGQRWQRRELVDLNVDQ